MANDWESIIKEEIEKMMKSLRSKGIDSEVLSVSIKIENPKNEGIELAENNEFLESDNIDDILPKLRKRKDINKKCSCCGKTSNNLRRIETGEYVCEECDKTLDIYRSRIKDILKAYNNNQSITPLMREFAEEIIKSEEDCKENDEEDLLRDFIQDELMDYAIFENKNDLITFLEDVINYVKNHEIDL